MLAEILSGTIILILVYGNLHYQTITLLFFPSFSRFIIIIIYYYSFLAAQLFISNILLGFMPKQKGSSDTPGVTAKVQKMKVSPFKKAAVICNMLFIQ